jgi:cytochrome c oxidase cbb3-type subunit 1
MLVMAWNTWLTIKGEVKVNPTVPLMNPDARDPALLGPASTTA